MVGKTPVALNKTIIAVKIGGEEEIGRIGAVFNSKGKMEIHRSDEADMGQDSSYLSDNTYPNCGSANLNKLALVLSMYIRHLPQVNIITVSETDNDY